MTSRGPMMSLLSSSSCGSVESTADRALVAVVELTLSVSKGLSTSFRLADLSFLVDFLQLLAFLFSGGSSAVEWKNGTWLEKVTYVFGPAPYRDSYDSGEMHFFYLALALVVVTVALCARAISVQMSSEGGHAPKSRDPLRLANGASPGGGAVAAAADRSESWEVSLLRLALQLAATVLFVPIMSALYGGAVSLLTDTDVWGSGAAHKVAGTVAALASLCYLALSTYAVAFVFDTHPNSDVVLSRPHTRVDLVHHALRVALVAAAFSSGKPTATVGAALVLGTCVAYANTMYLPYYRFEYALRRSVLMWLFVWASVAALVADLQSEDDTAASLLLYVGSPLVLACAYLATHNRRRLLLTLPVQELRNPFEVELKSRFYLADIEAEVAGMDARENMALLVESGTALPGIANDSSGKSLCPAMNPGGVGGGASPGGDVRRPSALSTPDSGTGGGGSGDGSIGGGAEGEEARRRGLAARAADGSATVEAKESERRKADLSAAYSTIRGWYEYSTRRFHRNPMGFVLFAQFHFQGDGNRQRSMQQLVKAQELRPRLDESYLIMRFQKMHEQYLASDAEELISYMAYQDFLSAAQEYDLLASRAKITFWNTLMDVKPDLEMLQDIGTEINKNVQLARRNYESALDTYNQSPQVLRSYASFLMDLVNDDQRADMLLARAEDIENSRTKRRSTVTHARGIDIFDDQNAVVIIDRRSLSGEMVSASAGAAAMFGYTQGEMQHKNVNILVPSPFSEMHDQFLTNYVTTGNEHIINQRRELYAAHKSGHIFPMAIQVRQISRTAFMGLIQRLDSADMHIMAREHGAMYSWTTNCSTVFPALSDAGREVPAVDVLPGFGERRSEFTSAEGAEATVVNGLTRYRVRVWQTVSSIHGVVYHVIRVRVINSELVADGGALASPRSSAGSAAHGRQRSLNGLAALDTKGAAKSPRRSILHHVGASTSVADSDDETAGSATPQGATSPASRARRLVFADSPTSRSGRGRGGRDSDDSGPDSDDSDNGSTTGARGDRRASGSDTESEDSDDSEARREARRAVKKANRRRRNSDKAGGDGARVRTLRLPAADGGPDPSSGRRHHHGGGGGSESGKSPRGRASKSARDTRSEHSKASGGASTILSRSTNNSENTADQLRRVILTGQGSSLGGFRALKIFFGVILAVVCAVAVGSFVANAIIMARYSTELNRVDEAAERALVHSTISYSTTTLALVEDGTLAGGEESYPREQLGQLADRLERLQEDLYLNNDRLSSENRRIMEEPSIPVRELLADGTSTERNWNLHQVVSAVVSKTRTVFATAVGSLDSSNPDVFFLTENMEGSVLDALSASTRIHTDEAADVVVVNESIQLGAMCLALGLVVAVLIVAVPLTSRVQNKNTEVMELFLTLPKKQRQLLLLESNERVKGLAGQEDAPQGEDENGRDEQDQPTASSAIANTNLNAGDGTRAAAAAAANGGGGGAGGGGGGGEVRKSGSAAGGAGGMGGAGSGSKGGREDSAASQRSTTVKRRMMLKFAIILLVSTPYFVGMYLWQHGESVDARVRAPEELFVCGRRELLANLAAAHVRSKGVHAGVNATAEAAEAVVVTSLAAELDEAHQSLLYGDETNDRLPGSVRRDAAQDRLLFQTNCYEGGRVPSSPGCETYSLGINAHGLNPALEEYLRVARLVGSTATAPETGAVGLGGESFEFVSTMDRYYLREGLERSKELYLDEAKDLIDRDLSAQMAVMLAFVAVLVLLYRFLYLGLIRSLEENFITTRSLLLILPLSVISENSKIRTFIRSSM